MMNQPIGQYDAISSSAHDSQQCEQSGALLIKLGIVLIVFSGILWFSLFSIPFLPISTAQKATVGLVTFVTVQITWWSGAVIVGPKAMKNFGRRFRN